MQASHYELSGQSTRVDWYPRGKGGPAIRGGPAPGAPLLVYSNGTNEVSVWGADLVVGAETPAGCFVIGIVKKVDVAPGAVVSFGVLIPCVVVDASPVSIHTVGALAVHRATTRVGPGQLATYTKIDLSGTASEMSRMIDPTPTTRGG
jgi:hypothetical protein